MRSKIIITAIIATVMFAGLAAIKHIDSLNDGIQLKQIEIQDNSAKLKLLNDKYEKLQNDKSLDQKEYEKQLKQLQQEKAKLESDLQAKLEAKNATVAQYTAGAVETAVAAPVPSNEAKAFIYQHESGNNPTATNSIGCYGIGQDCNGIVLSKCGANYACQDEYFTGYAMRRYGSWEAAYAFWIANNWW